jgi:hypothetical protein
MGLRRMSKESPMVTLPVRYTYVVEDVDRHGNVRLYIKRRGPKR